LASFAFDRTWEFPVTPAELWTILLQTDEYRGWWTWLRSFDAVPVRTGSEAHCTIGPPLPYVLRLRIRLDEVVPETAIAATVSGDLAGHARLTITPAGREAPAGAGAAPAASAGAAPAGAGAAAAGAGSAAGGVGSAARLDWDVSPTKPWLRRSATLARPVLLWGHEWVVRTGVEQFRARALAPAIAAR
jgi:uncharacterized protein YndB with AHSA1/START domain